MKKTINKRWFGKSVALVLSLSVIFSTFNSDLSLAATDDTSAVECVAGFIEGFDGFLQTIVSHHGFKESFTEYFKDIFGRNVCHANDILALDKQQDKIKHDLQQAYLNCKKDKIPSLEKAYFKVDAELYYARHIIETPFLNWKGMIPMGLGYEGDTDEEIKEKAATSITDRDTLYSEMFDKFRKFFDDENEFNELFTDLEVKYKDRKYSYVSCKGTGYGWEKVKEKFQEFTDNWGGVKDAGEDFATGVVEEYERGKRTAIDGFPKSFEDFASNTFNTTLNGIDPVKELGNILDEVKEKLPGNASPDLGDVFQSATNESDRFDRQNEIARLKAKYETWYKDTSDRAVQEFLGSLDELRAVLSESMVHMNGVYDCANHMILHQCK